MIFAPCSKSRMLFEIFHRNGRNDNKHQSDNDKRPQIHDSILLILRDCFYAHEKKDQRDDSAKYDGKPFYGSLAEQAADGDRCRQILRQVKKHLARFFSPIPIQILLYHAISSIAMKFAAILIIALFGLIIAHREDHPKKAHGAFSFDEEVTLLEGLSVRIKDLLA